MYEFRPMTVDDLVLVKQWLTTPHVAQWWRDPDEQFALVSGDFHHPEMAQFIVELRRRPFAYLQSYDLTAWDSGFGQQPPGTRGIDQFIGAPDMIGRGYGSAFIRAFVARLTARGVPRVVTDPDPANDRAVRAYERAGFFKDRIVDTPDGPALLMVCDA